MIAWIISALLVVVPTSCRWMSRMSSVIPKAMTQSLNDSALPLGIVGRSTGHRICQFRSLNLALSRDLLKTVQQEVYSSLSWSSPAMLAVNQTQAAQYRDLGRLPEA